METLRQKVKAALQKGFPRAKVPRLETGDSGSVIGVVVSGRFRDVDMEKRVQLVDDALQRALTQAEFAKVTLILAMAPEEAKARPDLIDPNGYRRNSD